jgi:hypothetical protein
MLQKRHLLILLERKQKFEEPVLDRIGPITRENEIMLPSNFSLRDQAGVGLSLVSKGKGKDIPVTGHGGP